MRQVVIVGGGLSGLAAAWELERLGVEYTIIEVKNRLGGNITSERRQGFVLDGGPFMMRHIGDWSFLADLGLQDSVFTDMQLGGEFIAFKDGTQTLVDALKSRIHGAVMTRMAVSSLGYIEGDFGVCLENGLMLNAKALIVAAPARYAERMFYSLQPEISQRLLKYHYDHITRISLGYRSEDIPLPILAPGDAAFAFFRWTDNPYRVPQGHILIQAGVRFDLRRIEEPAEVIRALQNTMGWLANPVVQRIDFWPEAESLTLHSHEHKENMIAIDHLLPPGAALIGSDYRASGLADRVNQARNAARSLASWLH